MTDMQYLGQERRKFPRLRVHLAVIYQVNKPLTVRMQIGDREIMATTLDLSEGGMAISADYDIPLKTNLMIKFSLFKVNDSGHASFYGPMEIIGEVRSNKLLEKDIHRLGICFIDIEEKDKKEIVEFVKSIKIGNEK
jgi:c-di-GMP-binding flagellar brake protein YcgR